MLPSGQKLVDEYMGDNEDPKTLMGQFQEMMADAVFVMPALHVAHFQCEYTCGSCAQSLPCMTRSISIRSIWLVRETGISTK